MTMTRRDALAAAIASGWGAAGAADGREPRPEKPRPGVSAEVRGTLRYQKEGNIYVIAIPPDRKGGREMRVWLLRGEDKDRELDRTLEGLDGKDVVAKGELRQMAENAGHAVIPPLGLYLDNHFTVEAAAAR